MIQPQLVVIAGPNGAGKSTFVQLPSIAARLANVPVVNPDTIAFEIDAHRRDSLDVQLAAGRIAVRLRDDHLAAGRPFAFETTLTGKGEIGLMRRAVDAGYKINFVFIGLDDDILSELRVQDRVELGGHDVPEADLQRRFSRSMANLAAALKIADRGWVFDNSGKGYRLLLSREQGQVKHLSGQMPLWVRQAIPEEMRTKLPLSV